MQPWRASIKTSLRRTKAHLLIFVGRTTVQSGAHLKKFATQLQYLGQPGVPLPLLLETLCLAPLALLIYVTIGWFQTHHGTTLRESGLVCLVFVVVRIVGDKVLKICKPKLGLDPAKPLIEPHLKAALQKLGKSLWRLSLFCLNRTKSRAETPLDADGTPPARTGHTLLRSRWNTGVVTSSLLYFTVGRILKYLALFFLYGGFEGHIPPEVLAEAKDCSRIKGLSPLATRLRRIILRMSGKWKRHDSP